MKDQLILDLKNTKTEINSSRHEPLRRSMRIAVGYDVNWDPIDNAKERRIDEMLTALTSAASQHQENFRRNEQPVPNSTLMLIENVIEQSQKNLL